MIKVEVPLKFLNTYRVRFSYSHKKFIQVKLSKYGASRTNGGNMACIARVDFGVIMTLSTKEKREKLKNNGFHDMKK